MLPCSQCIQSFHEAPFLLRCFGLYDSYCRQQRKEGGWGWVGNASIETCQNKFKQIQVANIVTGHTNTHTAEAAEQLALSLFYSQQLRALNHFLKVAHRQIRASAKIKHKTHKCSILSPRSVSGVFGFRPLLCKSTNSRNSRDGDCCLRERRNFQI